MTATKTQLTGGVFQDSQGNVLALGYLVFSLNQDNSVSGVCNIAAGIEIKVLLNSSGSVSTSPAQYIWATDVMVTANAYYRVTGYTAQGQPAWGPNNQQVTSSGVGGGTFDVGTWVPNSVFSWTPSTQPVLLETNTVKNSSQILLNLIAGSNITLSEIAGAVTIAASTGLVLKVNGTLNGSQSLLNLKSGSNTTVTDDGVGGVTIASVIPPVVFPSILPSGQCLTAAGSTSLRGSGWLFTSFAQTGFVTAINNGNNTTPAYQTCTLSSGSAGANGNWHTSTSDLFPMGQVQTIRCKVRLNQLTNIRMWIGVTTEVINLVSDLPNANIAAFRFSTLAGDTKWQCVTATDSSHATITPQSGNSLDTNFHIFEVQYSPIGPTITYLIDGVSVGSSITNIPTLGNLMYSIGFDNASVAYTPTCDFAWVVGAANF